VVVQSKLLIHNFIWCYDYNYLQAIYRQSHSSHHQRSIILYNAHQ